MDKNDYISKMNDILDDNTNFRKTSHNNLLKHNLLLEDRLNRFLKKLLDKKYINETEYRNMYAVGSNPGIIYGLPNVHKTNNPLRPVLSSFRTHNYNLAKFLIPFIEQHAKNDYTKA